MIDKYKPLLRLVLSVTMIAAGAMHFIATQSFARIVPDYLPAHRLLVYVSGIFELLLGACLLIPATRRLSGWGLVAFYIAVFPANLNMALHDLSAGNSSHKILLWLRLPLQIVLIAWAWWCSRPE